MLAKVMQNTYHEELRNVLTARNTNKTSFVVPKGISDMELLLLMRKRKQESRLHV